MEEENRVFGENAEAVDKNENLESEDFNFYHQNKEEAKSNIDNSAKDLTDFIDSLIKDVPDPSEDEVNAGIEKILEKIHLAEAQTETAKTNKNKKKKVNFKVLLLVAVLSILFLSCFYAVGSSHNISIENGFVAFATETVKVIFFGETEEKYITVDALLTDLEQHGYKDILFPEEFVTHSDEYKVSAPEYCSDDLGEQVTFKIFNITNSYKFVVYNYSQTSQVFEYVNSNNVQTLNINGIYIYVFEHDDFSTIEFINNNYRYYIDSDILFGDMLKLAETIE